nr:hypothetical protein [Haloterrigena salifodinae]
MSTDTVAKTVNDALAVPSELPDPLVRGKAQDTVFTWTLRKVAVGSAPEISFEQSVDAHKLFWIASRSDGDVVIDSVRGTESPLPD